MLLFTRLRRFYYCYHFLLLLLLFVRRLLIFVIIIIILLSKITRVNLKTKRAGLRGPSPSNVSCVSIPKFSSPPHTHPPTQHPSVSINWYIIIVGGLDKNNKTTIESHFRSRQHTIRLYIFSNITKNRRWSLKSNISKKINEINNIILFCLLLKKIITISVLHFFIQMWS